MLNVGDFSGVNELFNFAAEYWFVSDPDEGEVCAVDLNEPESMDEAIEVCVAKIIEAEGEFSNWSITGRETVQYAACDQYNVELTGLVEGELVVARIEALS